MQVSVKRIHRYLRSPVRQRKKQRRNFIMLATGFDSCSLKTFFKRTSILKFFAAWRQRTLKKNPEVVCTSMIKALVPQWSVLDIEVLGLNPAPSKLFIKRTCNFEKFQKLIRIAREIVVEKRQCSSTSSITTSSQHYYNQIVLLLGAKLRQ